jgi:hypothetical protein
LELDDVGVERSVPSEVDRDRPENESDGDRERVERAASFELVSQASNHAGAGCLRCDRRPFDQGVDYFSVYATVLL